MIKNPKPLHPGQVLNEVYMAEMNLNQTALAAKCKCSPRKISEIVNGERGISQNLLLYLRRSWAPLPKCGFACRRIMIYGPRDEMSLKRRSRS
jgi:addiction module HigA family antidote